MPEIAIIMGSDSDLGVMREAALTLESFEIKCEVSVLSAHRAHAALQKYVKAAVKRGVKVFIAGAGGGAHLPGVIAAITELPVIGVPIKSAALDGLDAILSIVQMPSGIPVAAVGVNGAKNAALLAVSMLALRNRKLALKLSNYRKRMRVEVLKKNDRLHKVGYKKYLKP